MNNFNDIILKFRSDEMNIAEREEFKHFMRHNEQLRKEFVFQEKLDKVMKQNLLLEAIENDPDLIEAEIIALKDIASYLNLDKLKDGKKNTNEVEKEVESQRKLAKAEVEMVLSGIDDISEVWVRNFEQSKPTIGNDVAAQQVIEYIKNSNRSVHPLFPCRSFAAL